MYPLLGRFIKIVLILIGRVVPQVFLRDGTLKILINSADGDEVTINLPIALGETIIKAIIKSNVGDKNDKGKQRYSTYMSASYPFAIKNTNCEVGVGMSLWDGLYSEEFNVASISSKLPSY